MAEITTRTVGAPAVPTLAVVPQDLEDMTIEEAEAAGLVDDYAAPEDVGYRLETSETVHDEPEIKALFFKSEPFIGIEIPTEHGPAGHVLSLENAMILRGVLGDAIEEATA